MTSVEKLRAILVFLLFISLSGCSDGDEQYQDIPLEVSIPSNFPALVYDLSQNPPTQKGFELGKKILYDGRLSSDGLISCGSCHLQQHGFTHHGHTLSHGVNNAVGLRNSQPIQNLAFQTTFMWDGATDHLDLQPVIPITSEVEMDGNLSQIITLMKSDRNYVKLYKQAFANGEVNTENMLKALSQFMVMAVSGNSRFDKFRRNEPGGTLTSAESQGYDLFISKCSSCHSTDLFTDNSFRNNGLSVNPVLDDNGRYRVTQSESDRYKFKVPSLRNVEVTAPYMHDGRFGTLESVLDHYTNGVQNSVTLDPLLKPNGVLGIPLSTDEKTKIIAFLKTLTDQQYLTDSRFSEF